MAGNNGLPCAYKNIRNLLLVSQLAKRAMGCENIEFVPSKKTTDKLAAMLTIRARWFNALAGGRNLETANNVPRTLRIWFLVQSITCICFYQWRFMNVKIRDRLGWSRPPLKGLLVLACRCHRVSLTDLHPWSMLRIRVRTQPPLEEHGLDLATPPPLAWRLTSKTVTSLPGDCPVQQSFRCLCLETAQYNSPRPRSCGKKMREKKKNALCNCSGLDVYSWMDHCQWSTLYAQWGSLFQAQGNICDHEWIIIFSVWHRYKGLGSWLEEAKFHQHWVALFDEFYNFCQMWRDSVQNNVHNIVFLFTACAQNGLAFVACRHWPLTMLSRTRNMVDRCSARTGAGQARRLCFLTLEQWLVGCNREGKCPHRFRRVLKWGCRDGKCILHSSFTSHS